MKAGDGFDGVLYSPAQRTYALPLKAGAMWSSTSEVAFSPSIEGLSFSESLRSTVEGWARS